MQVKSFNIGLGAQMQIQLSGMSANLKCLLVGMETDQYLVVRFPIISGVLNRLHQGNRATVRCIHAGAVYGFYCNVVNHVVNPAPLLFLSYPGSFEVLNLRKSERVECFVPTIATVRGAAFEGVILDISVDGCRFTMESRPDDALPQFQVDEPIGLRFELSHATGPLKAFGRMKNLSQDSRRIILGVVFEEPGDLVLSAIEGFVGRMLFYR